MARHKRTDVLFAQGDLATILQAQEAVGLHHIQELSREDLDSATDEQLIQRLVSTTVIVPPVLTEGAISVSHSEVQVDVAGSWERDLENHPGPYYVPGHAVTYHVPFSGSAGLFHHRPSQYTLRYPFGTVEQGELRLRYERTDTDLAATKAEFEKDLTFIKTFLDTIAADIAAFTVKVPKTYGEAIARRRTVVDEARAGLEALGLPIRSEANFSTLSARTPPSTVQRAGLVLASEASVPAEVQYDVALSFAGEQRDYVEAVAAALKATDVRVFYDGFETDQLWGKNLIDHLADIYQNRSRYVVMFISSDYVSKAWPSHERQHAQSRALYLQEEYILPARFDDTVVPGLPPTVSYVDLRTMSPQEFAKLIVRKLHA